MRKKISKKERPPALKKIVDSQDIGKKEILRAIAGNDTVLAVVDSSKNRQKIKGDFRNLLQ